jgi:hypothetical protein
VVVPGGYTPDMMRRHDAMVKLVRDAAQQGKVVAAAKAAAPKPPVSGAAKPGPKPAVTPVPKA